MEKLVIVVISLILLTESLDRKHVTHVYRRLRIQLVYLCFAKLQYQQKTLF